MVESVFIDSECVGTVLNHVKVIITRLESQAVKTSCLYFRMGVKYCLYVRCCVYRLA